MLTGSLPDSCLARFLREPRPLMEAWCIWVPTGTVLVFFLFL